MGLAMVMRNDIKSGIRTLWRRLRDMSWSKDAARPGVLPPSGPVRLDRRAAAADAGRRAAGGGHGARDAVVLRFPLHGEALLVKLADMLRRRISHGGPERDPLLLALSRRPGSHSGARLSIDRCAYVEFDAERSAYHVAIEAAPDTTVSLDTTDFDAVVNFVVQYAAERIAAAPTLEVAS